MNTEQTSENIFTTNLSYKILSFFVQLFQSYYPRGDSFRNMIFFNIFEKIPHFSFKARVGWGSYFWSSRFWGSGQLYWLPILALVRVINFQIFVQKKESFFA